MFNSFDELYIGIATRERDRIVWSVKRQQKDCLLRLKPSAISPRMVKLFRDFSRWRSKPSAPTAIIF
jgi:hypothetical protein